MEHHGFSGTHAWMDGWILKHAIQSWWWEHSACLISHEAHELSFCAVSPLFGEKWDDYDGRFSRDDMKALLADCLYAVFEEQKL